MLQAMARNWWLLLIRGLCAIVAGVIAFIQPGITLYVLMILIAANALVEGIACIVMGAKGGAGGMPWWEMILLGLLGVVFGIWTFFYPAATAIVLLAFIAYWFIIRGVMEIIMAIRLRKVIEDEWLIGLSGLFSIIVGIFLLRHPIDGIGALVMVFGVFMIMIGAVTVAFSLRLRKVHKRLGH